MLLLLVEKPVFMSIFARLCPLSQLLRLQQRFLSSNSYTVIIFCPFGHIFCDGHTRCTTSDAKKTKKKKPKKNRYRLWSLEVALQRNRMLMKNKARRGVFSPGYAGGVESRFVCWRPGVGLFLRCSWRGGLTQQKVTFSRGGVTHSSCPNN